MNSRYTTKLFVGPRWNAFFVVVCCAIVLGFGLYAQVPEAQKANLDASPDARAYLRLAQSILAGRGFDLDMAGQGELEVFPLTRHNGPTTFSPPLQPLQLALLLKLGLTPRGIAVFNAVLIALGAALLFLTLRRISNVWIALCAGILLTLEWPLSASAHLLLTEAPFMFLLLLLMNVVSHDKANSARGGILVGALVGLLMMCRGEAPLFLPVVLFLHCSRVSDLWKRRYSAAVCLTAALVISPWVIRNYIQTGHPVLTRNGSGYNMWVSNNPNTDDTDSLANGITVSSLPFPFPLDDPEMDEVTADRIASREARRFVAAHPLIWLNASVRRVLYFWQPMKFFKTYDSYPVRIGLWILTLLGLIAVMPPRKRTILILAPALIYTFVGSFMMGANMLLRFRAMAAPSECFLIASGLVGVLGVARGMFTGTRYWSRVRLWLRRRKLALAAACVAVPIILAVSPPKTSHAPIYVEDFENPQTQFSSIVPPPSNDGTQIQETDLGHVLSLDNSADPGWWQGVSFVLPPGQYERNKDYQVSFDARLGALDAALIRINAFDSYESMESNGEYQLLNSSRFTWNRSVGGWTRLTCCFTSPYKTHSILQIVISLANSTDTKLNALIDNIEVRQISFTERWIREYFLDASERRRNYSFFVTN